MIIWGMGRGDNMEESNMLFITVITLYAALLWLVTMAPYNYSLLIRALIHDKGYIFTWVDTVTGLSIFILLAKGLPPLGA